MNNKQNFKENKIIKRKSLRLISYDYSKDGAYFITICTKERKCLLSQILENNSITFVELLPYGEIVENYIKSINDTYNNIKICSYIIMPNHIHMICIIANNGSPRTSTPTNAIIPALISTFKRLTNKEFKISIWQRNYYEHIIRNEKEYLKIVEYIENNPTNWLNDDLYC